MTEPLRVTFDDDESSGPPTDGRGSRRVLVIVVLVALALVGGAAVAFAMAGKHDTPATAPSITEPPTTALPVTEPPSITAPPPSAPPTTAAGTARRYRVGDKFNARCTIAWPTAPARGTDSIQMRTSCPSVSDQYLFVDILYKDPGLRVSPSRSTMQVRGKVVDVVRDGLGFTVLAVYADDVVVL